MKKYISLAAFGLLAGVGKHPRRIGAEMAQHRL